MTDPTPSTPSTPTTTDPKSGPLMVGAPEACRMLGVGTRTLWRLSACGAVPSRKVGTRRLYSVRELEAWIAAGCPAEPGAGERIAREAWRAAR